MITFMLYVSRRVEKPDTLADELQSILAVARPRNLSLGITGALLATPTNFAQILEGSADHIELIMGSIRADRRHTDIEVVRIETLAERRFGTWNLAHVPSTTALDTLFAVLADEERRNDQVVNSFIDLIQTAASAQLVL